MLGYLSLGFSAPRPKFTACRCIAGEFGGIFLNPTQTPKFKHSIAQKTGRLGNRNEYIFSISRPMPSVAFLQQAALPQVRLQAGCKAQVHQVSSDGICRSVSNSSRSVYRTAKYRKVPVTKRCRRAIRGCGCISVERVSW